VKLTIPWLADSYESPWARVVQSGAGPQRGWVVLPEVNDEVLVAFDHGDIRQPYVIGGLFNGQDKPKPSNDDLIDSTAGVINLRSFTSRTGHSLSFTDKSGSEAVALATGDGGYTITLDQNGTKINVSSNGNVEIQAQQDIKLTTQGGNVEISGAQVKISASAGLDLEGGPTATLKGQLVQIN